MAFEIEYIVDTGSGGQISHQPDNALVVFAQGGDYISSSAAFPDRADYANMAFEEEPFARFTRAKVERFGVKTLIGIGAYGYYREAETGYSVVKVPVGGAVAGEAPQISVTDGEYRITYEITDPAAWERYRITFRQGYFAEEFIVRDLAGEIEKPPTMGGLYGVTVMGYRYDVQERSGESQPTSVFVAERPYFPPEPPDPPEPPGIVRVSPIMTSNTTPAPYVAAASSEYNSDYAAWKAFDGLISPVSNDAWVTGSGTFPGGVGNQWISIDLAAPTTVYHFMVRNRNTNNGNAIDFNFQGSNDNANWQNLHTVVGRTDLLANEETVYHLSSPATFRYFRIVLTRITTQEAWGGFGQIELWGIGG
jgi:hypothetical protein